MAAVAALKALATVPDVCTWYEAHEGADHASLLAQASDAMRDAAFTTSPT